MNLIIITNVKLRLRRSAPAWHPLRKTLSTYTRYLQGLRFASRPRSVPLLTLRCEVAREVLYVVIVRRGAVYQLPITVGDSAIYYGKVHNLADSPTRVDGSGRQSVDLEPPPGTMRTDTSAKTAR